MNNTNNKYDDLRREAQIREMLLRFQAGFSALRQQPVLRIFSVAYCIMTLLVALLCGKLLSVIFLPLLMVLYVALLALFAMPPRAHRISEGLLRAGVVNKLGEPPIVTGNEAGVITLFMAGIDSALLEDRKDAIENALNRRIVRIEEGADKRYIILHTIPGDVKLPERVPLEGYLVPPEPTDIGLGLSSLGVVTWHLEKMAHLLLGGLTGCGKTTELVSIIQQFLCKNIIVYLVDMKGGIDYPPTWLGNALTCISSRGDVLKYTFKIVDELHKRMQMFQEAAEQTGQPCNSITQYNRLHPDNPLRRIAVVFDETAEVLDPTGLDKTTKEQITAINSNLSTLARLGRAFGIHLILASQRTAISSSATIPAEVRANMAVRVAGPCDSTVSQMILDTSDAAELPKDIPGRFFTNLDGGTVFQGFIKDGYGDYGRRHERGADNGVSQHG